MAWALFYVCAVLVPVSWLAWTLHLVLIALALLNMFLRKRATLLHLPIAGAPESLPALAFAFSWRRQRAKSYRSLLFFPSFARRWPWDASRESRSPALRFLRASKRCERRPHGGKVSHGESDGFASQCWPWCSVILATKRASNGIGSGRARVNLCHRSSPTEGSRTSMWIARGPVLSFSTAVFKPWTTRRH